MRKIYLLFVVAASVGLVLLGLTVVFQSNPQPEFDGARAFADLEYQVALGARTPGSPGHAAAVAWMEESLRNVGWAVEIQETERMGHPIRNVIAKRGTGEPWIILGAHYDSRLIADQDDNPDLRDEPVPGANDAASGVAILLELARALPADHPGEIWLVMFDAEDNGGIESWDWILGSRAFAESLTEHPDAVVIVDMIGDADLDIYLEGNSDVDLRTQIWDQAEQLGYGDVFINETRHSMLDDHTPFLELGIPAIDIIDFDYPYWHTTEDTVDKTSAASLQAVGDVLLAWLLSLTPIPFQ
jgi:glutaminyl-peptide cyclotransferase